MVKFISFLKNLYYNNQFRRSFGFDDIAIKQQKNVCTSRLDADISSEVIRGISRPVPLIASNMSTVINADFYIKLYKLGALGFMHRALPEDEYFKQVYIIKEKCDLVCVSVGIGDRQFLLAKNLIIAGANVIVIDIAHGFSDYVVDIAKKIKNYSKSTKVVIGNTINVESAYAVNDYADALKVGIAQGCFAAGTRILMSNGYYKNIEDVVYGDMVINKNGKPAKVKKSFCTGLKDTIKIDTSISIGPTYLTADHKLWVGDLNSTSKKTIQSRGYAKLLDKQSKTKPKKEKYVWKEIKDTQRDVLLMPKRIQFDLPKTFDILIKKRNGGNYLSGEKYVTEYMLTPSYELGYIFGTFLGDGNANCHVQHIINKNSGKVYSSKTGSINWSFGADENDIVKKLSDCIRVVFVKKTAISKTVRKNVVIVSLYYKPLADFLNRFGKRDKKRLPENLLVSDGSYLQGLFDGLIDSDGTKENRITFANTSLFLIELFNVLNYLLYGFFPNNTKQIVKTSSIMTQEQINNCKPFYVSEKIKTGTKRLTKDYQIVKLLKKNSITVRQKVYDLEIDDETHSFIANNAIVHNSACETAIATGCTEKQFSTVLKFKKVSKKLGLPIISDGGTRNPADVVKAIGAGASAVMAGQIFARCPESAAEVVEIEGEKKKLYAGMSSRYVQDMWKGKLKPGTCVEGKVVYLKMGEPVDKFIERYSGAIRSGLTYSGARNIKDFQKKCQFIRID